MRQQRRIKDVILGQFHFKYPSGEWGIHALIIPIEKVRETPIEEAANQICLFQEQSSHAEQLKVSIRTLLLAEM